MAIEPFNGFCCLDHALCEETDESWEAVKHFSALVDQGKCERFCGNVESNGAMVLTDSQVLMLVNHNGGNHGD